MKKLIPIVTMTGLMLSGCGPEPVASGSYRAVLELPGGELPFGLELQQTPEGWTAVLVNEPERVEVPQVSVVGDQLELVLPAYNTRIDAQRAKGGFNGQLTLVKRGGEKQIIPFAAQAGQTYRFHAKPTSAAVEVGGRWAVTFRDDDGAVSEAVAEFKQQDHRVQGTFLTPTGDYRFLDGEVQGNKLSLSTFDGSHAFLFHAVLNKDGMLEGDFWSGAAWHESWVATRNADAALPDADSMTRWVGEQVEFAFPDVDGKMVAFSDPRFNGKVVVVTLAGSWCPNCHDEAAFMAPFYRQWHEKGLEVIALMFEHLDDFDSAAAQVKAFRDKFDIDYTLLVAGSSDKKRASETMTMLDGVYAFPTTIFIDRKGKVRRVHTGFQGPGTGSHYRNLVTGFTNTVETLLAEK